MKTAPEQQQKLDELDLKLMPVAEALHRGDAVLFPCNGLSMSVGGPSWEQLVAPLKSELNPPTTESDPRLVAQFYRNQYGDNQFFTRIRENLHHEKLRPGAAHIALAELPVNIILTTNFDDLLERALREAGKKVHVISDDREIGLWNERSEVQVLKLHGNLDAASTMVLSDEDYHRFLAENAAMRHKLIELLRFRNVVFIGCSMRDSDISLILHEAHEGSGRLTRQAYNLTFSSDHHMLAEWTRKGIKPIQIPQAEGESKADSLARVLNRLKTLGERLKGECDVLIVDDDHIFSESVPVFIENGLPGTRVAVARNGYEAARKMAELKPKIVVVDVCLDGPASLQGFNGFKFVDSFRREAAFLGTEFVLVSGFPDVVAIPGADVSIGDMAKSLGLIFLYKPDVPKSLPPIIQRRLNCKMAA